MSTFAAEQSGHVKLLPEAILALDWLRIVDLLRGLVVEVGCELGGSQVLLDGSVVFGMLERPKTPHTSRVVVKLTGWNKWGVGPEEVELFAQEVRTVREARGVLVAPAGFSPAAQTTAKQLQIEAVDAVALCAALTRLNPERRDFLWTLATSGDAWTPSCPFCLKKLLRNEVRNEDHVPPEDERVFDGNAIVADLIYCKRLVVARGSEVQFLVQARANVMEVAGEVYGDLLCDGPLILRPTAVVHGRVAARAMQVEEGAQLLATTSVLKGKYPPVTRTQVSWQWRCKGSPSAEGCAAVVFEPHDLQAD